MLAIQAVINAMKANPVENNILNLIEVASLNGEYRITVPHTGTTDATWNRLGVLGYGVVPSDELHITWEPVRGFNGGAKIANT